MAQGSADALAMFAGPLAVIIGLVFLTPLGSLFSGTSSVVAVVFIVATLLLQFVVVRRTTHHTVRTTQELHIRRKIQHAGSGVLVVVGSFFASSLQVSIVLACSAAAFYIVAQLRQQYKVVNSTYLRVFGPILRQHEIAHRLPGAFWFLLGCCGSLLLFPKDVAQLSVLHLSLGDPCASLFGLTWGHHTSKLSNGKTIAGVVGCMFVCFVTSVGFLSVVDTSIQHLSGIQRVGVMALCGAAGTLGEVLYVGCDDNLSLPLVSGGVMSMVWRFIA
ncbi:hypothetical protein H310_01610 [Aphanomyces invadans]|uniref:Dolichol kinase n=1 Tax=Aphanomyces invadans TaxID=157072 RepID=A0A024US71_9STRA|nr:hypothetical protein H310_01610 [Aphanomyces invadans]ETW09184.1 hypothetical protein H310_01610 [Aphanomyces invadans]|eukprot:XP_008862989.1 hypothetical protein H310_01610 [Aphanomyces invadans]